MEQTLTHLIQVGLIDHLAEKLKMDVTDETKIGLIREGRLQDDPTINKLNILVYGPQEDWRNERAPENHYALSYAKTAFEMGPAMSEVWLYRFKLEFTLFFMINDRAEAIERGEVILTRAQMAVYSMPVPEVSDFGETFLKVAPESWSARIAGGPGTFKMSGEMKVEAIVKIEQDF